MQVVGGEGSAGGGGGKGFGGLLWESLTIYHENYEQEQNQVSSSCTFLFSLIKKLYSFYSTKDSEECDVNELIKIVGS